jgi:putative ABC transport system permease protein
MLRSLLTRKLRLLLSVLAVVLGTMFMAGACTAGDTTTRGFQELFATINSTVDVQVTAKEQGPQQENSGVVTAVVPQSVADRVAEIPGVRAETRLVSSDGARVVQRNGKVVGTTGAPQFGTNWVPSGTLAQLQQGHAPQSTDEIAINRALADQTGYRIGDKVPVLTLAPARTFTLVGIFGYEGGRNSLSGASEVSFTTPVAQQLMLGRGGVYSSLNLHAEPGVSPERLKSDVSTVLGPGYVVRTGDEAAKAASGQVSGFLDVLRNGLVGFALVALFVGAFLIFNTFSMLVAQRTRELALLRAMGASRRQVSVGVLGEAALTGLVASAVGLLLGIGVGWLLVRLLERSFGGPLPYRGVVVKPGVVIGVLLVGTVMTVVATMAPALRASRVPPVAAMRAAETPDKPLRRLTFGGAIVLATGIVLFGLKLFGHVHTNAGGTVALLGGGVVLCFLGVAMISPLVARPVTAAVGLLFSGGAPGKLGRRNTGRNPRRTAVTAAALMIGVALVTGAAVFASSAKAGIDNLIGRDLGADLIVSTGFNAAVTGGFPPSEAEKIRQLDGVTTVVAVAQDRIRLGGSDIDAAALFDVESAVPLFHLTPDSGELRTPAAGEILLDRRTADARHLGVGDTTTLATARAPTPRPVRVIGIYANSQLASGPMVSAATAQTFTSPNARQAYVKVADPADVPRVRAQLDQLFAAYPDVTVNDQSEVTSAATRPLDVLLATITVLLGLAIVVAVLGVINTLLLSILERTREIGLLRAVGLSRGQTMRMVTVESVLISVFGALLGIAVGVALGVALVSAVGGDFLRLTMPWGYLVAAVVLAVIAGVVAAVIPAIRASRLNVLEAIAYE